MPRIARLVLPGLPHHVTQRGNRRSQVFFSDADRRVYLGWLCEYAQVHDVEVLAYCLMSNHVHLVVVPASRDSMQLVLRRLHTRYAQRLNRVHDWKGHVWQGRYFASVLDESYFWSAIRYVERNPVRAGIVLRAEDYPWSSARAHCGLQADHLLTRKPEWLQQLRAVNNWSAWLTAGDDATQIDVLRLHAGRGLPCGSPDFIEKLSAVTGRALQPRNPGRPWPKNRETAGTL